MKILIAAIALLFLCPAYADGVKDWQGADKWQHAGIGFVTAGACTTVFKTGGKCFLASELLGIGEQLYAVKNNPAKIRREGAYDFLAHTIGAYAGTVLASGFTVYPSFKARTFSLNIFKEF